MRFLSMLLLITGFASVCSAQAASGSLQPETVTTIVDKLVAGLDDYVFPERAATLKGYLRAHLGEYQQIHSPEALADRLTTDLRAVGQDKHLTIWYAPPTDGSEVQTGTTEEQMRHVMEARAFGVTHIARLPRQHRLPSTRFLRCSPGRGAHCQRGDDAAARQRRSHP